MENKKIWKASECRKIEFEAKDIVTVSIKEDGDPYEGEIDGLPV